MSASVPEILYDFIYPQGFPQVWISKTGESMCCRVPKNKGFRRSLRFSAAGRSNDRFWGMQEYINKIGGSYQQLLWGYAGKREKYPQFLA
ncbi:MAG: hypothetical protein IKH16_11310 [Selenomonadaceae bacterium]|nr:hypothetical protein [Selenomonadaceae bacterium]MBR4696765.1 hypothetical protein [Selenomonadaceae bacterium]